MSENEFMVFEYNFISPILRIEETEHGVLVEGTLLSEGTSKNGNLYTIDEMEKIATQAVGKPVFYGVREGIDPNTGLKVKNLHDDSPENQVGRIIDAWLDKQNRKIKFIAGIVNTLKFPDIIQRVKEGWGISIGGFVKKASWVLNEAKKLCLKIENMVVEHACMIPPYVRRGQDEAKIEKVSKIQETMIFSEDETFQVSKIVVKSGRGVSINKVRYSES